MNILITRKITRLLRRELSIRNYLKPSQLQRQRKRRRLLNSVHLTWRLRREGRINLLSKMIRCQFQVLSIFSEQEICLNTNSLKFSMILIRKCYFKNLIFQLSKGLQVESDWIQIMRNLSSSKLCQCQILRKWSLRLAQRALSIIKLSQFPLNYQLISEDRKRKLSFNNKFKRKDWD